MSEKQLNFLHIFSENNDKNKDENIKLEDELPESGETADPYEENIKIEEEIKAADSELARRRHEILAQIVANREPNHLSAPSSFAGLTSDEMAIREGFSGSSVRMPKRKKYAGQEKRAPKKKRRKTDKRFGKDAAAGEALDL